jgi:starvation-inducible DNA-binding protein
MMQTGIGISATNRQAVVTELTKVLADETVLYFKTKNAHWNVESKDFYDKHKFFEIQFGQLDDMIDNIAERIRTLGHYAPSSLKEYLSLTHLTEQGKEKNDSQDFIKELLIDHESIIISLRQNTKAFLLDFQDVVTSDFITGLMGIHEKMAWFLRSHVHN